MRVIESFIIAVVFLVFNIWLIAQLSAMGLGIVAQLLVAWFTTSVLVCAWYFYREERKKEPKKEKLEMNSNPWSC